VPQQVESVLDGSTEMTKFEEASRVLLGNRGYVCFTIDKVGGLDFHAHVWNMHGLLLI